MKVGDLVRKTTSHGEVLVGLVVGLEASEDWVKVRWGAYGTLWTAVRTLEVISESR